MAPSPELRSVANNRNYHHFWDIQERLQYALDQASGQEILQFAALIYLPYTNDADLLPPPVFNENNMSDPRSDRYTLTNLMKLMGMEVSPTIPGHYRPAPGFSPDLDDDTSHTEHIEDVDDMDEDTADDDDTDGSAPADDGTGDESMDQDLDEDDSTYDSNDDFHDLDDGPMDEMTLLRLDMENTVVDISFYFYSTLRMPPEDCEVDAKTMYWLHLARNHVREHHDLMVKSERSEARVRQQRRETWNRNSKLATAYGVSKSSLLPRPRSPLSRVSSMVNIDEVSASSSTQNENTSEPMQLG